MASKLMHLKNKLENSVWGAVLTAAFYAVLVLLILLYFTGNGEFLYEI